MCGTSFATTSSIDPNQPAQDSDLSSDILRANFLAAYNDITSLFSTVENIFTAANVFTSSMPGLAPATNGVNNTYYLNASGAWMIPAAGSGGTPGGNPGQIQFNDSGNFGGFDISGDCLLITGTGVITCTKTNGASFVRSATVDATNAANINTGILPPARLGTSYSDGQLLIGSTATGFLAPSTITAGAGIAITNGSNAITISATSGGGVQSIPNGGTGATNVAQAQFNLSVPAKINVQSAPYNASGFIAQTIVSGAVSAGSTNIPVASSANFTIGQMVIIALAGTSGTKNFAAYITAIPDGTHIALSATAVTALPPSSTSGTSGITTAIPSSPASFLVYTLGTTTLASSVSNGATSIPLTTVASYQVGQGVQIAGGATGGAALTATITAISGNTLTISPGISNSSGVASGANIQHDDTAAFQTAVNTATYTQNVSIYVPDGFYQINGPKHDSNSNALVFLPALDYWPNNFQYWAPQATVEITGSVDAPEVQSYLSQQNIPHVSGAVIQTNATGVSVFGSYSGGSFGQMTNIQFVVKNVTLRSYPNPNVTMIDGLYIESLRVYSTNIDTGDTGQTTQPTHPIFAIRNPGGGNGANIVDENLEIIGYYYGILINEHSQLNHIRFDNDLWPIVAGDGRGWYGSTGNDLAFDGCPHGIGVLNASVGTTMSLFYTLIDIEHQSSPSWATNIDDVNDTGNYFSGFFLTDFHSSTATVTNAINLHVVEGKDHSWPFAGVFFSNFGNSHYTSAPNGLTVYCADCTVANPCAGSGTGAMAKRLNNAWVCN